MNPVLERKYPMPTMCAAKSRFQPNPDSTAPEYFLLRRGFLSSHGYFPGKSIPTIGGIDCVRRARFSGSKLALGKNSLALFCCIFCMACD